MSFSGCPEQKLSIRPTNCNAAQSSHAVHCDCLNLSKAGDLGKCKQYWLNIQKKNKMVYLAALRFLLNSFKLLKVENLASTSCATATAPEVLFCVAQYDEQNFLRRTN